MSEIWKDIPNYEGLYQASDFGRIKTLEKVCISTSSTGRVYTRTMPEKIMKPQKNNKTLHRSICLFDKFGIMRRFGVHVVILTTFKGESMVAKSLCCHKDDVADNNVPDNLYWGTRKSNGEDAVKNGRMIQSDRHSSTKLNKADVIIIKARLRDGESPTNIAEDFSVSQACIRMIKIGRNWSHIS